MTNDIEIITCVEMSITLGDRPCNSGMYVYICITHPVATSHILIVLSRDADNTKSPAGKKATEETLWS